MTSYRNYTTINREEKAAAKEKNKISSLAAKEKKNVNNQKLLRGVQGGSFLEKSPPGRRRQNHG